MGYEHSILKILAYFDVFDYPLSKEEIRLYADQILEPGIFEIVLSRLVVEHLVFRFDEFYSLRNDFSLILRRKRGNIKAAKLTPKAYRISSFLYRFPFVRAVGISGSLSKNFADKHSDIDFFIITKANRLWIARTFMHLFKKLSFITGHQHWFCMNYYIDEQALAIRERNIFTALEVITLLPAAGNGTLKDFFHKNDWAKNYFPNYLVEPGSAQHRNKPFFKSTIEVLLKNRLGDKLDDLLLKLTTTRWKKKELQGRVNIKGIKMSLETDKHFSKPNPLYFQNRVLELYKKRLLTHSLIASSMK